MMNCSDIQERLSAMVDGELSSEEQETVLAHAEACAPCMAAYADWMEFRMMMDGEDALPAGMSTDFRARLASDVLRRRRSRITRVVGAVAAAILIAVALFLADDGTAPEGNLPAAPELAFERIFGSPVNESFITAEPTASGVRL
jgi:anti-sigma factor RsiW